MALLGMGANVQCNGYFPGCCSTKGLIFDSEGSTWTSSNVNTELKNDCHHIGSLPVSSPCNLLGYNKELLKQTMLKHESMFREQIQELHRLYHKQRELMDEIKRNELYNHNLRLEALRSNPSLSSKNGQKICFSPNLPWSNGQSSVLIAETIQLPLASAPRKSWQTCLTPAPAPAPIVTEESLKDPNPSECKYRKVGKKVLDLQLPADEYIDSEEGECLENERVTEVLQVSGYSSNRVSQVVHDSFEKPHETKSHGFADLHARCNLKEAAAAKSYDFGVAAYHRNNPFYDPPRRTDFGSQNFPNDVIQKLNKRQDLEACSSNPQPNLEKKHEWWSSSNSGEQTGRVLDSFAKGIYTEKQPVSVESSSKNLQELNGLQSFSSFHQIDQGPFCTERKFSSADSSVRTQDSTINGFLGPSSASPACSSFHIVSGADMVSPGISSAGLWRPPVSNFGQRSIAVQELPASLDQSSNSLSRISGFTQKELYQCMSAESGPSLDNQNFVLGSSFCSKSKLLGLPFIGTNDPNKIHYSGSSNNELRKHVKDSEDMGTPKNLNLNVTPADYSETTASQGIRITGEENKLHDSSIRVLPQLKENPVCKEKPHMSSDLQSFDVLPSEVFQNQSKNKSIEEIERGCILDVNSPHIHVPHQMPSDEQKKHESLVGIIDLNSCMIEDENMPTDVNFKAPVSPENKECSPPRGESDENQLEVPVQSSEQEDPEVQAEELVKIAAESLVSISGFVAHSNLQLTACSSSESFISSPLRWFAGIVSATANHPENEINEDFGKENDLEDFLLSDMDYFEFMTLNLTETKVKDCCCKSIGQTKQVSGSTSPTRQRKGRTNRVRWRKDFQSEILPSLASLSRYEVTEDLQTIGGLVASGTHPETGSQRNAGRNVLTRAKKRSRASTSNSTDMKKLTNNATQMGNEKRVLISWGKTCRKRRGKRIPITNPKFILRSI